MGTAKLGTVVSAEANVNTFQLVLLGAERARQIMRGSRPMLATEARHPTSIVLEEFAAGLLKAEPKDDGPTQPRPGTESRSDVE